MTINIRQAAPAPAAAEDNGLRRFDPSAPAWAPVSGRLAGPLPAPRALPALAAAGGRLYLFGGAGAGDGVLYARACGEGRCQTMLQGRKVWRGQCLSIYKCWRSDRALHAHSPLSHLISMSISIYPSVHPSIRPSVHPSIHPSNYAVCIHTCARTHARSGPGGPDRPRSRHSPLGARPCAGRRGRGPPSLRPRRTGPRGFRSELVPLRRLRRRRSVAPRDIARFRWVHSVPATLRAGGRQSVREERSWRAARVPALARCIGDGDSACPRAPRPAARRSSCGGRRARHVWRAARTQPPCPHRAAAAAFRNDALRFDPAAGAWAPAIAAPAEAAAAGAQAPPAPRYRAGFAGAGDALYLFGGIGEAGGWPGRVGVRGKAAWERLPVRRGAALGREEGAAQRA